jgi:hypothetical protein
MDSNFNFVLPLRNGPNHNLGPLPCSMPMLTMLDVVPGLSFFD